MNTNSNLPRRLVIAATIVVLMISFYLFSALQADRAKAEPKKISQLSGELSLARATISFKYPLSADELILFLSETELKADSLYFVETFEGEQVMGGYHIPPNQSVSESLDTLREIRLRATQSHITALERELELGPRDEGRKAVVLTDLIKLRARLASKQTAPSVYAINTQGESNGFDLIGHHSLVRVIRVLPVGSLGDPVMPSQPVP